MWHIFDRSNTVQTAKMDAFVRTHSNGHFMQLPQWAQVKTHWDWRGISVYQKSRQVAAVSVLIRPLPLGFSLFYIPRGPVCDRNDPTVWQELMDGLRQLAKKHRAILLYTDPDEPDSNGVFRSIMEDLGFTEKFDDGFGNIQAQHVFRLYLSDRTPEQIFSEFCSKTRYNIGLAVRKGVTVRAYSGAAQIPSDVLADFYKLMYATGQRDHFYVRDPDYFSKLMAALKDDAHLFMAYLNGQPIAGAIEGFCGKKAWYLYGASGNAHRNAMPNYLLQWTMIQRAMERSCTFYDFRGVPGNPTEENPLYGLYRFKKGFSGTYTKFTGLFTYSFHPFLSRLLLSAMKLRQFFIPSIRA